SLSLSFSTSPLPSPTSILSLHDALPIYTGDDPLRLYSIYAPSHHAAGIVQATPEDAERDEESGEDVPPEWTVQPDHPSDDKHARSEEHTSELQSRFDLVCRLLLEKKNIT